MCQFRRHKSITDGKLILGFMHQWNMYANEMEMQTKIGKLQGKKIEETELDQVSFFEMLLILRSDDGNVIRIQNGFQFEIEILRNPITEVESFSHSLFSLLEW
jgi:hypothetical protein